MSVHPIARLPEEWTAFVVANGQRAFRAREIFQWIQRRGALKPDAMTSVPASLRGAITSDWGAFGVEVEKIHRSADGTKKLVLRLHDGVTIETVLLPTWPRDRPRREGEASAAAELDPDAPDADPADDADAADEDDDADAGEANEPGRARVTQCISTQVGCAMGCVFCASGVAGLKRHLQPEEIVAQVLLGRALLEPDESLRNVVYMGMGEPLHNYESTVRSLRLLTHREGIGLSSRRVTVSTSGLIPEIARLGEDFGGQIGLAISLHATDDASRSALMPINRRYPLDRLMEALRSYPLPKRRRITIEYTLVAGKNDSIPEARRLAGLLRGLPVKVNLIPMNPIAASALGPPKQGFVAAFQRVLLDAGYSCFVRRTRGDDVDAACGQLALLGAKPKVKGFR